MVLETTITDIGTEAETFQEENMLILFGDNAPESIADYCYTIFLPKISEEVTVGMAFTFGEHIYKITAIGELANQNLQNLGHITVKFDGAKKAELPGSIHVEPQTMPCLTKGSVICIG